MAIYKTKNPTKDGRSYYFRIKYKDILGTTHDYSSPKFKTRKEAVDEESRYRIKINNNDVSISNITIKEGYDSYMIKHQEEIKQTTLLKIKDQYKHIVIIEKVKINSLTINHINLFKNALTKNNLSIHYKNKIIGLLISILKHCNKYHNTSLNILKYCDKFKEINKMEKEMLFFSYEEYKKFNSVIDDFDYKVFFELLYFLGLRQGELQALTFNDIDFEKEVLKINKTLTTKIKGEKWLISTPKTKNSIRILPIPKQVLNNLKTIKNNATKFTDYKDSWFVFGFIAPYKETTIQKRKNKYCELAEVKQIRIHDFRHSCASLLIHKNASIALVSKYLGHANISITLNTYTHMYKSDLENIKDVLNNL